MVEIERKKEYPSEVAVQLVSHLSEGAYTTFAKAVKELIINAFDANAPEVHLDLDADCTQLTIRDKGDGMNSDQFRTEFARIAGSKRRIENKKRTFNRPMIGKFGIGFLSAARLCKTVIIYSKQKGNDHGIRREIPLNHFFEQKNQLRDLRKHYYYYSMPDFKDDIDRSYTKIVLQDLREDIQKDLKSKKKYSEAWDNIDELSGVEKFRWELGILLPVNYEDSYPIHDDSVEIINKVKSELKGFKFKVFLNNNEILKPITLGYHFHRESKWNYNNKRIPKAEYSIIPISSPPGATLRFHGYIYNQSKQIQPSSLRGILLRINHVGIKGYSKSLFEFTKNIGPILSAISGEIFLDSQFEEVMTLDKDDFKEDHSLFKELVGYIHDTIDEVASISRKRSGKIKGRKETVKVKDLDLSSAEINEAKKILGVKTFNKEYFPNKDISIRTNVKHLMTRIKSYIGKTLNQNEASYLIESLECFNANCYRGAILMAWNTGMFRIHRKIDTDIGYAKLQAEIETMRKDPHVQSYISSRLKSCSNLYDLKLYSEEMICRLLERLQLMDGNTAQLFYKSLITIRNNCAHPTGYKANDGDAIFMIQSILGRILNNDRFLVN
ncbi:MAG: ATP-binding protein [bacterium]